MARLPTVGGDSGNWGTVLNDYLAQAHKPDGKLRADVASIAVPKAIDVSAIPDKMQAMVGGYYTHGDGGGGQFYYDAGASDADNAGKIIAPDAGSGRWKRIYSGAVNVRWFGAKGDGTTDDTAAIQATIDASGGREINFGDSLTFLCSAPILVGSGNSTADPAALFGDSALVFTHEQDSTSMGHSNPGKKQSGLHCLATPNTGVSIEVKGLTLSYTGTFDHGTNLGRVNGLFFYGYDRVTLNSVKATAFNACGVLVGGSGTEYTSINTKNISITSCNFSSNRVAGIEIAYTQDVLIQGCILNSNGISGDTGTGYGFAAQSGAGSVRVSVRDCTANSNYRKGLDVHSSTDVLLSGNRCDANLLYGIYVSRTTQGNATVIDNRVTGMSATASITPAYGIYVGQDEATDLPLRVQVRGNFVEGGQSGGVFIPFVVRNGGNNNCLIIGNVANCGEITNFVLCDDFGSGVCTLLINGNIFRATEVTAVYVNVYEENLLDFSFCDNIIEDASAAYFFNTIVKFNTGTPPAAAAQCYRIVRGNVVRVTAAASVTRFIDFDTRVLEERNFLRGVRHIPEPTYIIASGVLTIGDFPFIRVDTEGGASTDNLDTITAGYSCQRVLARAASSSRDVVLKDGTGNLSLVSDMTLTHGADTIELVYNSGNAVWQEIARSDNTA